MVLKVETYRTIDVDTSEMRDGDILVVQLEYGRILYLLPTANDCYRRWLYPKQSWSQDDRSAIERLLNVRRIMYPNDNFEGVTIDDDSINVYTKWQFKLDRGLVFGVEFTSKNGHTYTIGEFSLSAPREVTPSTMDTLACS